MADEDLARYRRVAGESIPPPRRNSLIIDTRNMPPGTGTSVHLTDSPSLFARLLGRFGPRG